MIHGIDTDFLIACEIEEHARHKSADQFFSACLERKHRFALTPMVLAEFLHVVTDAKRFARPLAMTDALDTADLWWNASETIQLQPDAKAMTQFYDWMSTFRLGRKRILDTLLAATLDCAGVGSLLTLSRNDFDVFGRFDFPFPPSLRQVGK